MSSSAGAMKLTLAAAIATAVASWACVSVAFGPNSGGAKPHRESIRRLGRRIGGDEDDDDDDDEYDLVPVRAHRYDVPPEILVGDCACREEVLLAVRLALEAGRNMTRHLNARGTEHENASDLDISTKSNSADLATAIDVLNEDLIARGIRNRFPSHRIIGEESTGSGPVDPIEPNGENTWIIDPIDGTTNFASGLPLCCVSIGMCVGGVPHMGVAYAPATDELYVAVRGRGAYRNGVRLSSSGGGGGRTLSDSVVGFEFGYAKSEEDVDLMTGAVKRLLRHGVRATRSLGSGVLDLCYVASGRLDVVYAGVADEGWKPWDYCAGLVVANEAGCTMTHLISRSKEDLVDDGSGEIRRGYEFNLLSRSVICGVNADLVEETRRVVLGL